MLAIDRVARRGTERRHMSERDSVLQLFAQAPRVFEVPLHLPLELREAFARPSEKLEALDRALAVAVGLPAPAKPRPSPRRRH